MIEDVSFQVDVDVIYPCWFVVKLSIVLTRQNWYFGRDYDGV